MTEPAQNLSPHSANTAQTGDSSLLDRVSRAIHARSCTAFDPDKCVGPWESEVGDARAALAEIAVWIKPRDPAWARIFGQEAS